MQAAQAGYLACQTCGSRRRFLPRVLILSWHDSVETALGKGGEPQEVPVEIDPLISAGEGRAAKVIESGGVAGDDAVAGPDDAAGH